MQEPHRLQPLAMQTSISSCLSYSTGTPRFQGILLIYICLVIIVSGKHQLVAPGFHRYSAFFMVSQCKSVVLATVVKKTGSYIVSRWYTRIFLQNFAKPQTNQTRNCLQAAVNSVPPPLNSKLPPEAIRSVPAEQQSRQVPRTKQYLV